MVGDFYTVVFPDVDLSMEGETQVCCPFPHLTSDGTEYFETNPSAGIDMEKGVFHCFVCGTGCSETGFIAKYLNISYTNANKLKYILDSSDETELDWNIAHLHLLSNVHIMETLTQTLKISEQTIKDLRIGFEGRGTCSFPVFLFGKLVDVRTYRIGQHPKYLSRSGAKTGLIIPYDLWKDDPRSTIICAGEKDMSIARTYGFNAINITGGEGVIPELFVNSFKNKKCYIIYDNDTTGKEGALKVAMSLRPVAELIKIIDLSDVCIEKGEDLHDFFIKYAKTRDELKQKIKNTPDFTEEDYQNAKEVEYPTVNLIQGASPQFVGKIVRSNVQVVATFENQFLLPSSITAVKIPAIEDNPSPAENKMRPGETRHWYLDDKNIKDMLYLIDSNLKERDIQGYIRDLLGISRKESHISIKQETKETVYKCAVTDAFDRIDTKAKQTEFVAYSLNEKLETGKKCKITYKLVPHPFDGQKLIMIILDVEEANDSVTNFKLTAEKIELLKQFQVTTTLQAKIDELIERVKGITGYNYNNMLIQFIDFWYHTVINFNVGRFTEVRGYLDALLIGESRTGKSDTAEHLNETYGLGSIVSLAGASATIAGLIGGSNKVNGSYQTRAGLLPQQHRSALVMEELAKCNRDLIKELTDVRSSGIVRITRVNGSISLPALVRMLTLTNTKAKGDTPKPITSYPNGISIIKDLIGTAEDIARYDMIAVFPDKGTTELDPFWEPMTPLRNEYYRARICWVWSRKPEQVIITREIYNLIIENANTLNRQFDSYIKIFGTEAWKKIARLSIAIAGYVVSTDETFENIIVKAEHVEYAVNYLKLLYDNDTFRFRQFVEEEKRLREFTPEDKLVLQDMYEKNATILLHLEGCSETNRNTLDAISGLPRDEFSTFMNLLTKHLFIQFSGHVIMPTERFRKGITQINRTVRVQVMGAILIDGSRN